MIKLPDVRDSQFRAVSARNFCFLLCSLHILLCELENSRLAIVDSAVQEEKMYAEQFIRECPQIRGCIENIRCT